MQGNNTNNYIEQSFCTLKDIIFSRYCIILAFIQNLNLQSFTNNLKYSFSHSHRIQVYNPVQVFQFVIMNMERFYEQCLLGFSHKHPGHLRIEKRFFCPKWETVDADSIQKTSVENEYLIPSMEDASLIYTVNSIIGVCTCPVSMSGAPCKH